MVTKNDLDGEIAQHLKRLSHKDAVCNMPCDRLFRFELLHRIASYLLLKALTLLSQLLKQKSAKEIVPIIPQWAFEYRKLLLDYNREVRWATHDTMTNLVNVVGFVLS
ncbi:E3 ubiquitin-protein ligase listerin [Abeliophyllum distichum]|uniref:E3 ubiquitin-protein ligase listerin n=1 Tax=Abeliophyllum distichum TaxID=126358 RepID=A0ABD1PRG1_9LAMI